MGKNTSYKNGKPKGSVFKYKFSFVMSVYNVEPYLRDAIDSILTQSMDFKRNCEIVFVNDGSTDKSEEVCLSYKNMFPNNIKYIRQKNKGLSAARNRGLEATEGKYISFFDPDDKLSPDTLDEVYKFFEKHYEEIDLCSIKLMLFEGRNIPEPLNFKYETSRIVDIKRDYNYVQFSAASSFFKSDAIKNRNFDTNISYSEDVKFITALLFNKMAYGVVKKPIYYWRKRSSHDSLTTSSRKNKKWYFDPPEHVYKYLIDHSIEKLGYISRYVQYLIMYDLQWRFLQVQQQVLSRAELFKYKNILISLLQNIDDRIIFEQKSLFIDQKIFILSKKYHTDVMLSASREGLNYYYKKQRIYSYEWEQVAVIQALSINGDEVNIRGYMKGIIMPGVKFGFSVGGQFFEATKVNRKKMSKEFLGEVYYDRNCFKIKLRIKDGENVVPVLKLEDDNRKKLPIEARPSSNVPLFEQGENYTIVGDYIVCRTDMNILVFVRNKYIRLWSKKVQAALNYLKQIKK